MSKTALLFPGQGAQHVGMGNRLVAAYPAASELFDRANEILGMDLRKLCFEGPAATLDSTVISQPALFVTSLAALEKLKADSPEIAQNCAMCAGLSLGEYTALVFAGALSFEDGLRVVQRRGQAMQAAADATPSGMVSILLLELPQVEQICRDASVDGHSLQIANFLCPGNLVVSGTKGACDRAAELAVTAGGRAIPLSVAGAFHTDIMKPADQALAEALAGVRISSPRIPVLSNVDSRPHSDPEEIRSLLVRQVLSPVRWEDSIRHLLDAGCTEFYEVGPGKVLRGLLKRISRKTNCSSVNDSFDDAAGV